MYEEIINITKDSHFFLPFFSLKDNHAEVQQKPEGNHVTIKLNQTGT